MPVWISSRCIHGLLALALIFMLSVIEPILWYVAWCGALVLVVMLGVDALLGPRAGTVNIRRDGEESFALDVPSSLGYAVDNRSRVSVRCGVIDTPVAVLEWHADELTVILAPLNTAHLERAVMPCSRGEATLSIIYVWIENQIGLLRRRVRVDVQRQIRVYPDLSVVARYGNLRSHNRLIESGLRKMRLRGAGTEFESLREWSHGDPYRAVDWKATARRGKLMVVQHEIERSQNIVLLLDCGRLMTGRMGLRSKLDYAITAALCVATIAGLANDRIGLLAFAQNIKEAVAPHASKKAVPEIARRLLGLQPSFEESDYGAAFTYVRTQVGKRSLIILFTDMFDTIASSSVLENLRILTARHLVLCIFMSDAAIDEATAREPEDVMDAYRASVALMLLEERRTAAAILKQRGVRVIDAPASTLSIALINAYLEIKERGVL